MGFSFFGSILNYYIGNCGVSGLIGRRMVSMQKKTFQKEVLPDTFKHNKDDPNQKLFEEDLALFIAKELVPLSLLRLHLLGG
jgi:hypothetical protein